MLVFPNLTNRCLRNPYESLRTSSSLFRYLGRDRLRSSRPASLKKAAELVGAMTVIVLTAICLLACAFYVYVLIHWIRETKREPTTRSAAENQTNENCERKRPHTIGSRRLTGRDGRFTARSLRPASVAMRSRGSGLGCPECERNVYGLIARSWSVGKRIEGSFCTPHSVTQVTWFVRWGA